MMLNIYLALFLIFVAQVTDHVAAFQRRNLFGKKESFNQDTETSSSPTSNSIMNDFDDELSSSLPTIGLDSETKLKLKVEASAPFRLLRQYLFFAMIGGGSLGTLIGIPQLIRIISSQNSDDVKTALLNLGINLGGVVAGVFLFLREGKQAEEKLERYRKLERRANNQLSAAEIERRERLINLLPVEILLGVNKTIINPSALAKTITTNTSQLLYNQALADQGSKVSTTELTRVVSINDLHEKARQSVIIVTGDYSYIKDCLVDLRIKDQELLSKENIVVVPFCSNLSDQDRLIKDYEEVEKAKTVSKKGFQSNVPNTSSTEGNAASLKRALEMLSAAYIGRPKQLDVWKRIMDMEFDLAEKQGTVKSKAQGISIILNNNGKIVRRGVGVPIWDSVIKELKAQKQ